MKKEAVLHSTLELVSELGIHNTPMSKVAKRANVAVGTIYHHFSGKEEILNELYLAIKKEFGERTRKALERSSSPEEAFSEVFKTIFRFYTDNPLKFKFTEQVTFTPIITEETLKKSESYYRPLIVFIEDHLAKGTFREVPIELLTQMYYGNVRTLIQMKLSDQYQVDETMLEEAIHTTWISFVDE